MNTVKTEAHILVALAHIHEIDNFDKHFDSLQFENVKRIEVSMANFWAKHYTCINLQEKISKEEQYLVLCVGCLDVV